MKFSRLNIKIIAGIITVLPPLLVVLTLVLFFLYRNQMIQEVSTYAGKTNDLMQASMEGLLQKNDPSEIRRLVEILGHQPGVEQSMLLNAKGVVRFSSDPRLLNQQISYNSPGCNGCHHSPRTHGGAILVTLDGGRRVFRSASKITNRPSCFPCHGSQGGVIGVLVMDFSTEPLDRRLGGDVGLMLVLSLGTAGILVALLWLLLSRTVVARIQSLGRTAQAIGKGNLAVRARVKGRDEIAELADQFNSMTGSLVATMETVRAQEQHLEALLNSMDDCIVVVDRHLRIVMANKASHQRFERPGEGILGLECHHLINKNKVGKLCREPGKCPALETFRTGKPQVALNFYQNPEGDDVYMEVHTSPLLNETGEVFHVIEVWRDFTDRKKLEAQLEHSERLASLGLLASGVAHEINNPLAAIQACVEGLQRRIQAGEGNGDWQRYLAVINSELNRMKATTERLLAVVKKPKRNAPVQEGPGANLNRCLQETYSLVNYQTQQKKIQVEQALAPDPLPVDSDETAVRQVILNLLLNAIQEVAEVRPGKGVIKLRTAEEDGQVVLRVIDNGGGIEREKLKKVFEPFYSGSTKGGTGLGLFIVKTLVEEHGGSVEVISEAGKGSEFVIKWPKANGSRIRTTE